MKQLFNPLKRETEFQWQKSYFKVLKSLDVMNDIASVDYRDWPIVSTELVNFLSLNTSVEAVDKLKIVTDELSDSFRDIIKNFTTQTKSLQSIGKKHDELKTCQRDEKAPGEA